MKRGLRAGMVFLLMAVFANGADDKMIETDAEIEIKSGIDAFILDTTYTRAPLFECTPSIKAVYRILSTKKLRIVPLETLHSDTTYRCVPNRKYISAPEEKIDPLVFKTEPFALKSVNYYPREKVLDIRFNDTFSGDDLKRSLRIYKQDRLSTTSLQYAVLSVDGGRAVIKITEPVEGDISIALRAGFASASGGVLSEEVKRDLGSAAAIDTKLDPKKPPMDFDDLPRAVALDDGTFAIRLFFEDPFEEEPVKEYISIDGIDNFRVKKDRYISDRMRKENNISDSYYYVDVLSDEFQPDREYTITLKKGLKNYSELKKSVSFKVKTKDRKSGIYFDKRAHYISNKGEIAFSSVNLDRATLTIERVTEDNYRYFINYNESDIEKIKSYTEPIYTGELTLDNTKNVICKQKFRVSDIVRERGWGVYRVVLDYDTKDAFGRKKHASASKVIFVSDLAISANLSNDQIFVAVNRLSDAKAVADARVTVYSSRNTVLATAVTNKDGVAIIERKGIVAEDPKTIVVTFGRDRNFLLLEKPVNGITPIMSDKKETDYRAYIYFQSDIVRPGGDIHALVSVKDPDLVSADKIPLVLTLSRSFDSVVSIRKVECDSEGLVDFSYSLDPGSPTGPYFLTVKLGDKIIGKKRVDVEAFMPPQIENEIKSDKKDYGSDEYAEITVVSRYMFGAPAAGLNARLSFSAVAYDYNNTKYPDYIFTDKEMERGNDRLYIDLEEETKLDDGGKASALFPCATTQRVPSILKATIGATVMDDAQPVSTYDSVFIYPYKRMAGLRLDSDSIKSGERLKGSVVLIDPFTGEKKDGELSVVIKKTEWFYSYSNGSYEWKKDTKVVDSFSVKANTSFERPIENNGDYTVEIIDRIGGHSVSSSFEVSGWNYNNISPREDLASVEIDFEDRLYRKGDVLKVSIKSPVIAGSALVTIEGDKVYWYKRFDIDKGTAQLDIPLSDDLGRGRYLHVSVVRKTDTGRGIVPFRASGYRLIKSDRTDRRISLRLDCEETARSRSEVELQIETDREASVLVSVVDSAIMNIAGQKRADPFGFFTPAPPKEISYYDIYDKVIAYLCKGKLVSFGAGDVEMAELRKKHMAPANLERIKPFMLWSGVIHTKDKKAVYRLKIPQFNGRASIVAIAVSKNATGAAMRDIVVKDEIMLKPSLPRFMLLGDRMSVALRVFNSTSSSAKVRIGASASDNFSLKLPKESIEIAPHDSMVLYCPLEAIKEGKGEIEFSAEWNGRSFVHDTTMNVSSQYAVQSIGYRGSISSTKTIAVPSAYLGGKVLVSLADNIMGSMQKELKYLISYPYGCAEQTASKIAAMLYSRPFLKNSESVSGRETFIHQGIRKLSRLQNIRGEFSYWLPMGDVDPYASIYASEIMLDLDKQGYNIGGRVKKSIVEALKNIAVNGGRRLQGSYDPYHRVYAAFVLSEHGLLDEEILNLLYDSGKYKNYYISRFYMAAMMKNAGRNAEAEEVLESVKKIDLEKIGRVDYDIPGARAYASRGRDAYLLLYLEAKYFGKRESDFRLGREWLGDLHSTHEMAMAFRAIGAWLGRAVSKPMRAKITIDKKERVFDKSTAFTADIHDGPLIIEPLSGVVNYMVEFYKALPLPPKNSLDPSRKLSIKREFVDVSGNSVDMGALEQGSRIYAKITLSNFGAMKNVVLDHRIPACMEIVNRRMGDMKSTLTNINFNPDYTDIRDDRILHFFDLKRKSKLEKIPNSKKKKRVTVRNFSTIYIPLSVTGVGECAMPPVTVEKMYDSRVHDYALDRERIRVHRKGELARKSVSRKSSETKKVREFLQKYYDLESSSSDPGEFVKFFKYPLKRYFGRHDLSADDIERDRLRYFKSWPVRKYKIKDISVFPLGDSEIEAEVSFEYTISDSHRKISGSSRQKLRLKREGDTFHIYEVYAVKR